MPQSTQRLLRGDHGFTRSRRLGKVTGLWIDPPWGHEEVLAFLHDLSIPFDTNQAEHDLRMRNVQHKIAGSFCSDRGADAFTCLRGYLPTLRKHGVAPLAARDTVVAGRPLSPDFA